MSERRAVRGEARERSNLLFYLYFCSFVRGGIVLRSGTLAIAHAREAGHWRQHSGRDAGEHSCSDNHRRSAVPPPIRARQRLEERALLATVWLEATL